MRQNILSIIQRQKKGLPVTRTDTGGADTIGGMDRMKRKPLLTAAVDDYLKKRDAAELIRLEALLVLKQQQIDELEVELARLKNETKTC